MNRAYELAKTEIGTVEWKDGSNPRVVAYFRDAGHASVTDDATAWCAAFVGAMLRRCGFDSTGKLTARSYLDWGEPVALADAQEGDIVVFKRGNSTWQGHVGFFVQNNGSTITVLGGNQADAVNRRAYPVSSLLGVRRMKAAAPVSKPVAAPVAVADPDPAEQSQGAWSALVGAILAIFGRRK